MIKLLSFLLLLTYVHAAQLPSYIKACNVNDPNINRCATISANNAIPTVVKGDPAYHIPNMLPLKLPDIRIVAGRNLKFDLSDTTVDGMDSGKAELYLMKDNLVWTSVMTFDELKIKGKYVADGQLLVLPITGNGNFEIKLQKPKFNYTMQLEDQTRDGVQYTTVKSSTLTLRPHQVYFNFENLFNGDKTLGDQMNKFMNENWKEVTDILGPTIVDVVKTIVDATLRSFLADVPKDDIFLQ